VVHSFDYVPRNSVCTVTETAGGSTSTITAITTGYNQEVTAPAGGIVALGLLDG
jgi:hypothetical protein